MVALKRDEGGGDTGLRKQRLEVIKEMIKGRSGSATAGQSPSEQTIRMMRAARTVELLCYSNKRSKEEYEDKDEFMKLLHRVLVTEAKKKPSSGSPSSKVSRPAAQKRPRNATKSQLQAQPVASSASSVSTATVGPSAPASSAGRPTYNMGAGASQALYSVPSSLVEQKVPAARRSVRPGFAPAQQQQQQQQRGLAGPAIDTKLAHGPIDSASMGATYPYMTAPPFEAWSSFTRFGTGYGADTAAAQQHQQHQMQAFLSSQQATSPLHQQHLQQQQHLHLQHQQHQLSQTAIDANMQQQRQDQLSDQQQRAGGALSSKEIKRRRVSQPSLASPRQLVASQPQTIQGNRRHSVPGQGALFQRPYPPPLEPGEWVEEMADFLSLAFDEETE